MSLPPLRRPVSAAARAAVRALLDEAEEAILRNIAARQRSACIIIVRTTDRYVTGKLTMRDGVTEARELGVFPLDAQGRAG